MTNTIETAKALTFGNGYTTEYDNFDGISGRQEVVVSVRPEEFIIQPEGTPGVTATVKSSVFLGLMTTYFVELFDGNIAEITEKSSISSIIPDGTKISLGFEKEKINVFTADGERSLTKGVVDDAHA